MFWRPGFFSQHIPQQPTWTNMSSSPNNWLLPWRVRPCETGWSWFHPRYLYPEFSIGQVISRQEKGRIVFRTIFFDEGPTFFTKEDACAWVDEEIVRTNGKIVSEAIMAMK